MAEQIIVIDKVEDDSYEGKEFKKVTDKAGKVWKIKQGREGALKDKWHLLEEGKAIRLTMGSYQDKPFVRDIETVEDIFIQQAQEKVESESALQQFRLSGLIRATELTVAGVIDRANILLWADVFYSFIKDGIVSEELTTKIAIARGVKDETKTFQKTKGDKEVSPTEDRQPQLQETGADDSGGRTEAKTTQELMSWCIGHGKKYGPTWVRQITEIGDTLITDAMIPELQAKIRNEMKWED